MTTKRRTTINCINSFWFGFKPFFFSISQVWFQLQFSFRLPRFSSNMCEFDFSVDVMCINRKQFTSFLFGRFGLKHFITFDWIGYTFRLAIVFAWSILHKTFVTHTHTTPFAIDGKHVYFASLKWANCNYLGVQFNKHLNSCCFLQ